MFYSGLNEYELMFYKHTGYSEVNASDSSPAVSPPVLEVYYKLFLKLSAFCALKEEAILSHQVYFFPYF